MPAPMRREQARTSRSASVRRRPISIQRQLRLDPNTHTLVLTTAFLTSVAFAVFAMNVLALVLSHLLT
jgi:hypothetical protein